MPIPIIHLARHVGQFMHMIIGTLYGGVYLPVLLMVRGIVTQGQVTGHVTSPRLLAAGLLRSL